MKRFHRRKRDGSSNGSSGISPDTALADAGYGNDRKFRDGITALGLTYVVGIQTNLLLWKADAVPPLRGRRGCRPSHAARREQQVSVRELALASQPMRGGPLPDVSWTIRSRRG